jgi:hypothetical protein
VFEHILVAEEILGRDLLPDETRPQPSGIRVSDAVAWAREILNRFDGACAPPTVLTSADVT